MLAQKNQYTLVQPRTTVLSLVVRLLGLMTLAPAESMEARRIRTPKRANVWNFEIAERGEPPMRRMLFSMLAAAWLLTGVGCIIPIYSADPARRAQELIFTSEDLRAIL